MNPRLWYSASEYQSHARVAQCYRELLKSTCELTTCPERADIAILHHEPHNYGAIYREYPALASIYVIAYCVWEASELPDSYKRSIAYVQELWTCSHYCYDKFNSYHNRVMYIPHVIERNCSYSKADHDFICNAIQYETNAIYYLTITKVWDRRKNADALVRAFKRQSHKMPNARLIVKAGAQDVQSWVSDPHIIYLPIDLTDWQLNALYDLAHVYVSAHHSEGWGLTLSDAMLFKKPVVATGYSGNLEFMNQDNSFLLSYDEQNIRPEDSFGPFHTGMRWAYPDDDDIDATLVMTYKCRDSLLMLEKIRRASTDIKNFTRESVDHLLRKRIAKITE